MDLAGEGAPGVPGWMAMMPDDDLARLPTGAPGVAPRWPGAGIDEATVVVHYPASDGYVAHSYRHDPARREIALALTGSGERADCHVLLPAGVSAATAAGDGVEDGADPPLTGRRGPRGPFTARGRSTARRASRG